MNILSAEDLVVLKVLFNRPKDWDDIRQVVLAQRDHLDTDYVMRWLDEMLGPGDRARNRFVELAMDG